MIYDILNFGKFNDLLINLEFLINRLCAIPVIGSCYGSVNVIGSRLCRCSKTVFSKENVSFATFNIIFVNNITKGSLSGRIIRLFAVCPTGYTKLSNLRISLIDNNGCRNFTSKIIIIFFNNHLDEIFSGIFKRCYIRSIVQVLNCTSNRFVAEEGFVKFEIRTVIDPSIVLFCKTCNRGLRLLYNYLNFSVDNVIVIGIFGSEYYIKDIFTCYINGCILIFPFISRIKRNILKLKVTAPSKSNNL